MARLSSADPIEKFRFEVTFLSDPSIFEALNTTINSATNINNAGPNNFFGDASTTNPLGNDKFSRAGFSEATIPKITVTETVYRENVNGPNFIKIPGMIRYDNLILRRGVTSSKDFYEWLKSTQNTVQGINTFAAGLTEFAIIPTQEVDYRADLVVSSRNRDGSYAKHWFFYNCFVSSYKAGDDLDASSDSKLIEELSLSFEIMLESTKNSIVDAINDLDDQAKQALLKAALISVL